ncbi:hypothetical protein [Bacillus sp. FJAT-45037]|uniref:hypothetical protein n=1 Tax=Bacillus sp. FJAT-45037 TaxID=2011007 RepID=UPI000C2336A8|nr:hypothetical protein [Bacillus sp. FJAT-45037]
MKYLLLFFLLVSLILVGCSPSESSQSNNADLNAEIVSVNEDDTITVNIIDAGPQGYRGYINHKLQLGIPINYSVDDFQEGQLILVWLDGLLDTEPPSGTATKLELQ